MNQQTYFNNNYYDDNRSRSKYDQKFNYQHNQPQPEQFSAPPHSNSYHSRGWNPRNPQSSSESSPRPKSGPVSQEESVRGGAKPKRNKPFYKDSQQQQQHHSHSSKPSLLQQAQTSEEPETDRSREEQEGIPKEEERESCKKNAAGRSELKGRKSRPSNPSNARCSNGNSVRFHGSGDRVFRRNGDAASSDNGDDATHGERNNLRNNGQRNNRGRIWVPRYNQPSYDRSCQDWLHQPAESRRPSSNQSNHGAVPANQNRQRQNGYTSRYDAHRGNVHQNFDSQNRFQNQIHHQQLPQLLPLVTYGYPSVSAKPFNGPHPSPLAELEIQPESLVITVERPFPPALSNLLQSLETVVETEPEPPYISGDTFHDQLSIGIWSKFLTNQQSADLLARKIRAWAAFHEAIKKGYSHQTILLPDRDSQPNGSCYGLFLVGSTFTGFGLNTSDIDICLMVNDYDIPRQQSIGVLNAIRNIFSAQHGSLADPGSIDLIHAKVPILKFWDRDHEIQFDVNCNNPVGIRNTHLLYCYGKTEWRVKPLVVVVKAWAKFHGINEAKEMTLSSYSLTLMVINYLQCGVRPVVLPCLQKMYSAMFSLNKPLNVLSVLNFPLEDVRPYKSANDATLGELLIGFLEYYSTFNFAQNAISVRLGSLVPVESCRVAKSLKNEPSQWRYICIEEPFDQSNTARSVFDLAKFEHILAVFRHSARVLKETRNLDSIFTSITSHAVGRALSPNE